MANIGIIDARSKKKYKYDRSFEEDREGLSSRKGNGRIVSTSLRNSTKRIDYNKTKRIIRVQSDYFSPFESSEEKDAALFGEVKRALKELEHEKKERARSLSQQESMARQANDKMIKELLVQIDQLKRENSQLKMQNERMYKVAAEAQHTNRTFAQEQKTLRERAESEKKERTEELLREIGKLKETAHDLKISLEKSQKNTKKLMSENKQLASDNKQLASENKQLISENKQLIKQSEEREWETKFVTLFVDMFQKISDQIEEGWSLKKKVQICWKINKNIMHKAISNGIQPPKIEKAQETSVFLKPGEHGYGH